MECSEVRKRLSAYIEKVVSPKQKALIDAHLKGCKQCKRALTDLKKAIEGDDKEVIETKTAALGEASGSLAQKLYAEQAAEIVTRRPLLSLAIEKDEDSLTDALEDEAREEREKDRVYWAPLRAELEALRHDKRSG